MNETSKIVSISYEDPETQLHHSQAQKEYREDSFQEDGAIQERQASDQSDASSQEGSLEPKKQILLKNMEKQNRMLKQRIYDLEIQQRKNMSKIIELEMNAVKSSAEISEILKSAQNVSILSSIRDKQNRKGSVKSIEEKQKKEERKFIEAIKENYRALFGIQSLKEIWKKHKQILAEWVLHQN